MKNVIMFCLLFAFLPVNNAFSGVIIGGIKFIYKEEQAGMKIFLSNRSNQEFLINSKLLTFKGGAQSYFFISPPLFKINAGRDNYLKVLKTQTPPPSDRESMFILSVAAIPQIKSLSTNENAVQIAVRNKLVFIYRPLSVPDITDSTYKLLKWSKNNHGLHITNPTPHYITLSRIYINGVKYIKNITIEPYSDVELHKCNTTRCTISWSAIDDTGKASDDFKIFV